MDTPKPAGNAQARRPGDVAGQWMFHVLRENPCPYLPDRLERKLMTRIEGQHATAFYTLLSQSGFRRSHIFAYRPACHDCSACVPVRVKAADFRPSRTQRRLMRTNQDLTAREVAVSATDEQYELFQSYVLARHHDGEMADMRFEDYRGMVEDTHLDTRLSEYRLPSGALAAVCLTDWLADGGSAVYSFFDPKLTKRSLGTWMILDLIEAARRRGLAHVYLGYWIENAPKMAYKQQFRPLEGLGSEGWQVIAP